MSALPTVAVTYPWPADVLAVAADRQANQYLDPLLEGTRRLFPTGEIKVFVEHDPELAGETHLVFEVEAPSSAIPNYVKAQHFWIDELYRVCPAPDVSLFRLALIPVAT